MEPLPTIPKPLHCGSYRPGHETHWIPVLRVYANTERLPVTFEHVDDAGWIKLEQDGEELVVWHHDVERIKALSGGSWRRVGQSDFYTVARGVEQRDGSRGGSWVCTGSESTTCPNGIPQMPKGGFNEEDLLEMLTERGGFTVEIAGASGRATST